MDVKNIVLGTKADYRSIHMAWFYQYEILERSDSIRKKIRRPPCQSSGMTLEPSSHTSSGACRQRLWVSILPTGVWHHFCAHVGPRPIHQRADSSSGRRRAPGRDRRSWVHPAWADSSPTTLSSQHAEHSADISSRTTEAPQPAVSGSGVQSTHREANAWFGKWTLRPVIHQNVMSGTPLDSRH